MGVERTKVQRDDFNPGNYMPERDGEVVLSFSFSALSP